MEHKRKFTETSKDSYKKKFNKFQKQKYRPNNRNYHQQNNRVAGMNESYGSDLLLEPESNCSAVVLDPNPTAGPYKCWKSYLPHETYNEDSNVVKKLQIIEKYLLKIVHIKRQEIKDKHSFTIDVKYLSADNEFIQYWPNFIDELRNAPQCVLSLFGLAMHHILVEEMKEQFQSLPDSDDDPEERLDMTSIVPIVYPRFIGLDVTPLKNLKTKSYKKFISVRGTVIRVGNVKPLCIKLAFKCNKCYSIQVILQPNGNYSTPNKCISRLCFSRSFEPLRTHEMTDIIPYQNIRLQELTNDEHTEKGRVPRTVECELTRDLVDRCIPGDIITVSGTVKINAPKEKSFGAAQNKSIYVLYILANSVECLKEKQQDSLEVMPGGLQFDTSDLYVVRDVYDYKYPFHSIVSSLCPNIYGHEIIKAGLALSLFGGTQRRVDDNNPVPVRGDSHVLIVGDPGLGKSQMLLACANVSPRGVYVCGNSTTSSGLTVTLTKDAGGENVLDAGALVLADQGCCCIDEFDKMTNQHQALLEAMEQQTISIAKGGISTVLPARASVIAAANPVGGHYNKAKTVSENIKLGGALLSRFDLVFIIVDKADQERDTKLSAHVMAMHMDKGKPENQSSILSYYKPSSLNDKSMLANKLQFESNEELGPIPTDSLRKYIAYARKYAHPKLSPEASTVLKNFYIELRKQHQNPHSTPITTRQLESLKRLTEARARVELRELCTQEDAEEVVEIMRHSMVDTYSDEFGKIDFERSIHGSGMSKQSVAKKFLSLLTSVATRTENSMFTISHMESIAQDAGIGKFSFNAFLDSLNNQGFLIKKGPKLYHLQTV